MRNYFAVAAFLSVLFFSFIAFPIGGHAKEATEGEVSVLVDDVYTLNMINTLNLSRDQLRLVVSKAKEARDLRAKTAAALEANPQDAKRDLLKLKERLLERKPMGREEISAYLTAAVAERDSGKKGLRDGMARLVSDVKGSLAFKQLYILRMYEDSIGPLPEPKMQRFDVKATMGNMLDGVRKAEAKDYENVKLEFIRRVLERAKTERAFGILPDKAALEKELSSMADEARRLASAEYDAKRPAMVDRLAEIIEPKTEDRFLNARIEKYLLSEKGLPLLEKKLAAY